MEPEHSTPSDDRPQGTGEQPSGNADSVSATNQFPIPIPSLQELRELPQRILPEQTYTHLQNAGREALLAIYSLWRSIDSARKGPAGNRVRKHIDVE